MTRDILIWWIAVQAFGLAGLPLARFLFRALPDRGYAFSKTLGLLLTGYLAWLLAMLGLAPFGAGLVVVCGLVVAGTGLLLNRRPAVSPAGMAKLGITATPARASFSLPALRGALVGWLRGNWRMVIGYEILFALTLIFLALLRSHDYGFVGPNPWGTERPMDYALFNAIRRSSTFPPHDPWLAGYSINYYYFGYLLMACVALISNLDPAVAYNLSLALIFALTALGVAGIVANLIALTQRRPPTTDHRPATSDQRAEIEDSGLKIEDSNAAESASQSSILDSSSSENSGWKLEDDDPDAVQKRSSILHSPPSEIDSQSSVVSRQSSVVSGLAIVLAVVLVLFAGNQAGVLQVIIGDNRVVALDARQLGSALGQALGGAQQITLPYAVNTPEGEFGTFYILERKDRIAEFDWWWPSRTLWDDYTRLGDPSLHYVITEFPFFSFWLGDMHPHVMSLPFGLLALALALQTITRPAAPAFAMGRRGWLELALTGIVLGSLYTINSWDLPTYVLLFLGALLILYVRLNKARQSPIPNLQSPISGVWWRLYTSQAAMVLIAAAVLFAPFHLTFRSLVGGKEPLINVPILATITRTLGFVNWGRTPLHSFLIIFGLFLLPLLLYVFGQGLAGMQRASSGVQQADNPEQPDDQEQTAPSDPQPRPSLLIADQLPWKYLPVTIVAVLILGPLIGFPLLVLLPLAVYAGVLALDRANRPAAAFVLWAFALGCLICFGTDIVYIRDVFESRFNTIFKFYYQVWLIWGALAGYPIWWLWTRLFSKRRPARLIAGILFTTLLLALLAGGLIYPWLTAGKAFRESPQVGLAGKTPRQQVPEGAAAIDWLRANAPGEAVILEAVGDSYDTGGMGFGGVSSSTGLATVLGWPGHEQQWRGGDPDTLAILGPRQEDVKTIYSSTDVEQAHTLLEKYKVRYIYVGRAERETYPGEGLAKLDQLGTVVFQQGEVTIYEVNNPGVKDLGLSLAQPL